jgi:hypothetical protein
MGVPTSEVGYTSATAGRGDHEVHKGYMVALGEILRELLKLSVHKNIDGILNILKFVHNMSADIVCPSSKDFIDLKTYTEINTETVIYIIIILTVKMNVRVSCVMIFMFFS